MTTGSATQYAVRTGQHVNVELRVNFQRAQYYHVETINRCAFRTPVSVLVGADFDVIGVTGQRLRSMAVKALHIQQFADQTFFVQVNHRRGNTAQGEVGANIAATHFVFQETGYRQRCATGTGLHGETFFEVARVDNHIRSATGNKQFARVSGHTGRASADFCSIANAVNFDDQINLILLNACRIMRIRQQFFGKHHDLFCVVGINHCIAEGAAAGFTGVAVGITEFITGRDAEESHVDIQFAALYQMHTTAVRVDLHRFCQQTTGDLFRQWTTQAGGINAGNHALANVFYQRRMAITQGAGRQGQVFKAHLRDDVHHHIDGQVTATESVMEGNRHAVL